MNELQHYLVEEAVEDYEEGRLTRREALKAIAGITGAALAAQMLEARAQAAPAGKLPASSAPLVAPDDPSIVAGIAEFPGEGVRLDGYLARPAQTGRFPVVLVCHERSEEHTSELQSRLHLVCRLLLEKKKEQGLC